MRDVNRSLRGLKSEVPKYSKSESNRHPPLKEGIIGRGRGGAEKLLLFCW